MRAEIQPKVQTSNYVHKNLRKLFIGGIPSSTTFKEFRTYFEEFGELSDVILPKKDPTSSLNCGYGFITYKNSEDAIAVLTYKKHHTLRAKWVI